MKIVCLGSGNVATHLAKALKASGADLIQVWSKTLANAQALANVLDTQAIDNLASIDPNADLYLISVKDDAIAAVASHLKGFSGMVVHTSGATPMSVFEPLAPANYGVLYPLQTFSKGRDLEFKHIPLCLEAVNPQAMVSLHELAISLSTQVHVVNSADRKILHLAAVYACNFTNHLYHLSATLLAEHHLSFDLLKPLIMETAEKVQSALPVDVQTGPALRNDELTMQRHLDLIKDAPTLTQVYETLSNSIKKTYL